MHKAFAVRIFQSDMFVRSAIHRVQKFYPEIAVAAAFILILTTNYLILAQRQHPYSLTLSSSTQRKVQIPATAGMSSISSAKLCQKVPA